MRFEIEGWLYSDDVKDKLKLLVLAKDSVKNDKLNVQLKDRLSDYMSEMNDRVRIKYHEPFWFYGPTNGLSAYTASQLLFSLKLTELKDKIFVLNHLEQTLNGLSDSKNALLKITTTKELLKTISSFLGDSFYDLTDERPCKIFYLPYKSKHENAFFDFNTNSIVVFKTKEEARSPEFVFAHELGHMTHAVIFDSPVEVPTSFVEFNMRGNPGGFVTLSNYDKRELYADFFSQAVMVDTPFENLNPLITKENRWQAVQFKEYFMNELARKSYSTNAEVIKNEFL